MVKNLPANAGDAGSIPGSGRPPGGGHGSPLQCSCLENPMDRGAWGATVRGAAKSWTGLSDWAHVENILDYLGGPSVITGSFKREPRGSEAGEEL